MAILESLASQTPVVISPGCHFDEVEKNQAEIVSYNDPLILSRAMGTVKKQTNTLKCLKI